MRTGYLHYYSFPFVRREVNIRDFKIRYGKGLLWLHKVKITVTSPCELQYGFPAVASFSPASNYLLCRTLHYVSINCHFVAILELIPLF